MNTSMLLSPHQWAEETFGSVHVGDQRRSRRVVQMAARIAHDPAGSLPAQMQDHAMLEGAYRLLHCPDVTYDQLIAPHVQQTPEAAGKVGRVLLIQDTTQVDYQQYPTTSGLGPIGKENARKALLGAKRAGRGAAESSGAGSGVSRTLPAQESAGGRKGLATPVP